MAYFSSPNVEPCLSHLIGEVELPAEVGRITALTVLPMSSVSLKQWFKKPTPPVVLQPQGSRAPAAITIVGAALTTFFYWKSAAFQPIRLIVEQLQDFVYDALVILGGVPGAGSEHLLQLVAYVAVAAIGAWLVVAGRNPDQQRAVSIALGLMLAALLFANARSETHFDRAELLILGWVAANYLFGRPAVYLNLLVAYLLCSCVARNFAEPTSSGFQHAVALARDWGVGMLGWPIGVGVMVLVAYLASWTTGRTFGINRADRFLP